METDNVLSMTMMDEVIQIEPVQDYTKTWANGLNNFLSMWLSYLMDVPLGMFQKEKIPHLFLEKIR